MPKVTMASVSLVKRMHSLMTRWNSTVLTIMRPLGVTTILALGSFDLIRQLT